MRYKYIAIPFVLGLLCLTVFQVVTFFPASDDTVIFLTFLVPIGFIFIGLSALLIIIKIIITIKQPI